ncbi:MAG: 16S rRNA (cytidine(1402)-2'-O)-methyltransferase [Gemmatimonadales bacterium]|nr:16S rRNA (cytidine(1402)-2'-O)-methyltransferase [Gemmatimonadales bacterium]
MRGGTLYVVATPLGHLGDLTARAAELLRAVAVVAAEDTRRTRILLDHLEARPRVLSYHAHSAPGAARQILSALADGSDVALVTDAGTPGISDPGAELVAQVRESGFAIVPLPGPSAVTTALSAAGLPADRYVFLGFLPRKGSERERQLKRIAAEESTMVFFESPNRLAELLRDLAEVCGDDRRAMVGRELTKMHEELRAGTLAELLAPLADGTALVRGECTVVVAGGEAAETEGDLPAARLLAGRLLAEGVSRKAAAAILTEFFGVTRNVAYKLATEAPEA